MYQSRRVEGAAIYNGSGLHQRSEHLKASEILHEGPAYRAPALAVGLELNIYTGLAATVSCPELLH